MARPRPFRLAEVPSLAVGALLLLLALRALAGGLPAVDWSRKSALVAADPGADPAFAARLASYLELLPPHGPISFLGPRELDRLDAFAPVHYAAQARLVPRVLTLRPGARFAIVECADDAVADERLQRHGYRWLRRREPGRGVAVRTE